MPNGNGGGGFDFGSLFDALLGSLAAAIEAIIAFLQELVAVLVQALNFLFGFSEFNFALSFDGLGIMLKDLKGLWDVVFKNVVLLMLNRLWDLYKKILAFAQKLKKWLDQLHALERQFQIQAFKQVINLMQRIRQILLVFRFFHLKFATKLDNWLGHLEGLMVLRHLQMVQKTNEIIQWLNLILDPVHGLTHLPIFLAAAKSADAALVLFTGRGLDWWYSKKPPAGYGVGRSVSAAQWYSQWSAASQANAGEPAAWRANFAAWSNYMQEIR